MYCCPTENNVFFANDPPFGGIFDGFFVLLDLLSTNSGLPVPLILLRLNFSVCDLLIFVIVGLFNVDRRSGKSLGGCASARFLAIA